MPVIKWNFICLNFFIIIIYVQHVVADGSIFILIFLTSVIFFKKSQYLFNILQVFGYLFLYFLILVIVIN